MNDDSNPIVTEVPSKYHPDADRIDRILRSFTYHAPKDDQPERYNYLRETAKQLALDILRLVPPGIEQNVAITILEEVIMWANKGIACGE